MINLNGEEFNSPALAIFNNGVAGRVDNVSISVEKRRVDEPDNQPDYKVHFTDSIASINLGIYYPSEQSSESQNKILASKCADLVKSVMGNDFIFPEFNTYNELVDFCMKTIKDNCDGKKVNVIVTYGSIGRPKKYLGVYKNFNFVEQAGTTPSRISVTRKGNQYDDLLERIVEDSTDAPQMDGNKTSEVSWLD